MVIQSNGTGPLQPGQWPIPVQPGQAPPQNPPVKPALAQPETHQPTETRELKTAQGQSKAQMAFVSDPGDEAYASLNPAQKQQFDFLTGLSYKTPAILAPQTFSPGPQNLSQPWGPSPFENVDVKVLNPAEQKLLKNLLANGTLQRKCSDGQTVLGHLVNLAKNDKHDKNSTQHGQTLVRDLLKMLQPDTLKADMALANQMEYHINEKGQRKQNGIAMSGGLGNITQCPEHYTCGAATMQVWMRLNHPEELVRITDDLFSKGESRLNGDTLKPPRGSLDFHAGDTVYDNEIRMTVAGKEDRCDLDILLQSALMDKVAIGNFSPYDVDADSGGIMNVIDGNSGGHPLYMKREMEHLTGKAFTYAQNLDIYSMGAPARFLANLGDRTPQADLVQTLKSQAQSGKQVMIAYQTRPGDAMALHYVTVVGYDPKSDRFYYADTDEKKADGAKMYTKTSQDMMNVLRAVIYEK